MGKVLKQVIIFKGGIESGYYCRVIRMESFLTVDAEKEKLIISSHQFKQKKDVKLEVKQTQNILTFIKDNIKIEFG